MSGGGSCLRLFLVRSLPLRGLPCPSHPFLGSEDPGPDPEYKAGPVIGAWAACGRVTGERPAPAEDVSGSGPKNSPSWGRGEPSAGTGAGGCSRCARLGPRQVRAGRCLGAAGLVCNRANPSEPPAQPMGQELEAGGKVWGTFQGLPPSQAEPAQTPSRAWSKYSLRSRPAKWLLPLTVE